jgi:mono/diheme cytochrome c family protein
MKQFSTTTWLALLVLGGTACADEVSPPRAQASAVRSESSASPASAVTPGPGEHDRTLGQQLFGQIGCNGCHTIDDVGGMVGPNLTAVGSRPSRDPARWPTTEAYVRASIEGPAQYVVEGYTPDMPPSDLLGIDAGDIDELVAYLLTLTDEQ